MNPYEELGVSAVASADEIKRAWRRRAAKTHPDREGGSDEAFKSVQKAYEVLSDPELRKAFDETGVIQEGQKPLFNMAVESIASLSLDSIDADDVLAEVRKKLHGLFEQHCKGKELIRKRIVKLEHKMKMFKKKTDGDNIFENAYGLALRSQKEMLKEADRMILCANMCFDILDDYEFIGKPSLVGIGLLGFPPTSLPPGGPWG